MSNDPFAQMKAAQREGWALFVPLESVTTIPAAQLVKHAGIRAGQGRRCSGWRLVGWWRNRLGWRHRKYRRHNHQRRLIEYKGGAA